MDFLLDNAEAVQQRVFYSVARLLQLEVDLCVFRSNPISRFGRIRSPISLESDRAFRSNPIGTGVGGAVA
jgi:hypothetical protein